jgi:hypothetical protein
MDAKPNSSADAKGRTPFQRFQALAKGLIRVPRSELNKKIAQAKARKHRKTSR